MTKEALENYLCEEKAFEGSFTVLFFRLARCYHTVIDVGAACGYYTRIAHHQMKKGKIYAYEPSPLRFNKLKKLETKNTYFHQVAISDKKGVANFQYYPDEKTSGRIISSDEGISFRVKTDTLDALHDTEQIDAIKIDTEGHEIQVLTGAKNIIKRCQPDLFIEYHDKRGKIIDWLMGKKYKIIDFSNGRLFSTPYEVVT